MPSAIFLIETRELSWLHALDFEVKSAELSTIWPAQDAT